MASGIQVRITGMKEVGQMLTDLPEKFKTKVAVAALRETAKVVQAAVDDESPIADAGPSIGLLKANVKLSRRKRNVPWHMIQYIVYVNTGRKVTRKRRGLKSLKRRIYLASNKKPPPSHPYYWFMVEFGTSKQSANPFMSRAFEKSAANGITRARDLARYRAEKELRKLK